MFIFLRIRWTKFLRTMLLVAAVVASAVPTVGRAQDGGGERRARDPQTGALTFLGFERGASVSLAAPDSAAAMAPRDLALVALERYAGDFGVANPGRDLVLQRSPERGQGGSVRYQQLYKGVPVLAGELLVNLDDAGRLRAIIGEASPNLDLSVEPTVSASAASTTARGIVAKHEGLPLESLSASPPSLWVYDERLLKPSERPPVLVWRTEVSLNQLSSIDELVLVDAHGGRVVLKFNQVDLGLNRSIYDNNNNPSLGLPGGGPVRTEGGPASGIADVNNAYDFSGDTYDFYMSHFARDSLDGAGEALISTTRYCDPFYACPFANAFWSDDYQQMVYGQGYASADDVVGHELTHGVTSYESNLFYYYQSGAINESLSDVFGEFIDLTNGAGTDTAGVRWLMGEDVAGGAIRSMKDPTLYGDPDKMSSVYYFEGDGDSGGVHYNSGINNKAAYLMTDGGSFNGQTVTGLGIDKVAAIYYEAQANLLTSGADYADLAQALYQACLNRMGGPEGILLSDCSQVAKAIEAVEMEDQPSPGFNEDAAYCPSSADLPLFTFIDDFESGSGGWTSGALVGDDHWFLGSPYGDYAHSGEGYLFGDDYPGETTDTFAFMTSGVMIPPNVFLHFAHAYLLESYETTYYDGGVLEYSANGGPWTDAGSLIEVNAYDGTLEDLYDNPLGGRSAFSGDSHGYISSRVNLNSLAGDSVRFRWRIGLDVAYTAAVEFSGWWVDDVAIYRCASDFLYLPLILR